MCLPCIQELHYTYRYEDVYPAFEANPFILLASDNLRVLSIDFSMTDETCKAVDYITLWTDPLRFQPTKLMKLEVHYIDFYSIHCDSLRHLINLEELTIHDGASSASSKQVFVWSLFEHLTRSASQICFFLICIGIALTARSLPSSGPLCISIAIPLPQAWHSIVSCMLHQFSAIIWDT